MYKDVGRDGGQRRSAGAGARLPLRLGLLNEPLPAPGTGDGNLPFPPGDPHHLPALGAPEIPVAPVLYPIQNLEKPAVFPVTLVLVPG